MDKGTITDKQILEFLDRLEGKEGCNFHKPKDEKYTWICDASKRKPIARKILTKMKISACTQNKFLKYCETIGGYCDCEIILNAEPILMQNIKIG